MKHEDIVEMERHIKTLGPKTVLDLHSRKQKDLFCSYFRARWGRVMEYKIPSPDGIMYIDNVFSDVYNEGIKLLSSAKVEITCERLEKFFCIMRDTWFKGEEPNEGAILPRVYNVTTVLGCEHKVMTIMQICRNWPWVASIVEKSHFVATTVHTDSYLHIVRLPEITINVRL